MSLTSFCLPANYTLEDAVAFGDDLLEKYIDTKSKLKAAEDTLAEIDFDVFAMEADYIKLQAEHEALKLEKDRLTKRNLELLLETHGYIDCR
jgi:hypothetical protein